MIRLLTMTGLYYLSWPCRMVRMRMAFPSLSIHVNILPSSRSEEELSYFTLKWNQDGHDAPTSLFGIACTRHLSSNELLHRPSDVTRSSVQKAVVAIVDSPYLFARIREKLSAVTKAWFAQKYVAGFQSLSA